jgi:transcription elongation factor
LALLTIAAGCGSRNREQGVNQTGFPGQVTAGGGTSGEVMSRSARVATEGGNARGTPGIPQGSEGNVGGTAMGGTTGGKPAPAAGAKQ